MATNPDLRSLLGTEFDFLPQNVSKKIENQFSSYEDLVRALKEELSDSKAFSEKNAAQLSSELKSSKDELSKATESCEQFTSKIKTLQEQLSKSQAEVSEIQNNHRECANQILQLQSRVKQLSQEKLSMAEVLEKRDEEIRKLEGDMKNTCTMLASANTSKMDALVKVQEAEIENDNCKHQMKRLNQEKDLLNEQVANLNREINDKSTELLRLRREKSSRVLELQSELDLKVQELELSQSQSSELRNSVKVQDKRVNALTQRVREVQEAQHKSEEQFTLEINAHIQLTQLHKTTAEESQSKVKELMKTIEEIHQTCTETAKARDEAALTLKEIKSEFDDKTKDMEAEAESLNEKLKEAQLQLDKMRVVSEETLAEMFPEAAASNRFLHKGMSLTEMYTTYRRSEEELVSKTRENKALKEQLKYLHEEIEEREPMIKVRMQELAKATETVSLMQEEMHKTCQYVDKLESERDDAVRLIGYHKREHARMKQTAADLATQVQFLLKELEEASGRRVLTSLEDDPKLMSLNQSATGLVISEHLVTFKSIQELQEQNEKLLAVSRDLGEQLEERDMQHTQEKTAELKEELEKVMRELGELREEREVQKSIVESIAQQRDSLRMALMHTSGSDSLQASPAKARSPKLNASRDQLEQSTILESERAALKKAEASLEELKEEFKVYKKDAKENATMLQEENNKLRDSLSEVRLQMAKSSSMLEFTEGRLTQVKSNLDMERKELAVLRDSSQNYANSIVKHQQTISLINKELYSSQEKLSHAEVTLENLKSERDLLKATEVRLLQEREAARAQNNSQAKVMSHLQAVQNNLDRLESETQVKQTGQIKNLTEERNILRSQLDSAHQEYVAAVKAWETKLTTLQARVSEEQEKSIKSREELVDSYANMHTLKMELADVQLKLKVAEEKISKTEGSEGAGARGMNLLRQQLNSTKLEVQNLQQKLGNAQQNENHFSGMVDDLSKQLKEAKETHAQSMQKLESALVEKNMHNKNLLDQITEISEQQNILSEELFRSSSEKDAEIQTLKEAVSRLNSDFEAQEQKAAMIHKMELQFEADRLEQAKLLIEAQDKYQRELMLHAVDSQALVDARNRASALDTKMSSAEGKCVHLEEMLEELRSAWGQQEEAFKGEAQALREKAQDAEAQCSAIHQQLELMSSQLSAMKATPDWTLVGGGTQETPTEHLQEVIRFLRKDKEIAVTQCSASQSEAKRLHVRVELLVSQLKEAEKDLLEERSRNRSHAATQAEHGDIMKKLEMMNLLHESNRCLREEKDAIVRANKELKEQVSSLQSQLSSLGQSTHDLTSQVETLSAENSAVRSEIKKWQARAAALTEQSRRHDPQDFRRMEEENAILKEDMIKMRAEAQRLETEAKQLNANIAELRSELLSSKKAVEVAAGKQNNTVKDLEKVKAENTKTTYQLKMIARKYKAQFDELKTKHDQLEASHTASLAEHELSAAAHQAALEVAKKEVAEIAETKAKEAQEKATTETAKLKEDLDSALKAEEVVKSQLAEKEERTRKIMLQAKKKLESLQADRETKDKTITDLNKENKDLKVKVCTLESLQDACQAKIFQLLTSKELSRQTAQRSLLEAKASKFEKEIKLLRERLEAQAEMVQRKPVSRPSTSAGTASSTIQEPLTANIRPMTPPVVTSGSSLRHPPHPTPAAPRTTPTASIRPMAIGTSGSTSASSSSSGSSSATSASASVASSSTGGHSTRMAAVPPTSANISSDGEPVLVSTAHVLPTSSVPQATVQPTPAMAALVTPLAPPTPPPSAIQGQEQTASSSGDAVGMDESRSHHGESEDDRCVATSSTSSSVPPAVLSGSVSVASTSPQTQVVAPTLKRSRAEESSLHLSRDSDSQPDTTGPSAPQLKRIRLAGEAQPQQQHLMERASVVTSGGGVLSSLPSQLERASSSTVLAVTSEQMTSSSREESSLVIPASAVAAVSRQQEDMPPERPGVIVTPEPQPIVVSESASSCCASSTPTQQQQHHVQASLASILSQQEAQEVPSEEPTQTSSDLLSYSPEEEESPDDKASESTVPKSVEFSMDDPRDDQSKVFAEEGEEYEEEEDEEEECMEEEGEAYDDEKMQEARFSQDEDEMADDGEEDSPIEPDTEDMTENVSEDQIIDDVDEEEDESQMDAQETSAVSMVPGDTVLVQGSSPSSTAVRVPTMAGETPSTSNILSSSGGAEAISATIVSAPSSLQQPPHRPPVLPRVPPRSERLPSSQTSGFEDGDDGIVPSTPTLFVPRRGDGFAEAVSSPHVPHGRFLFTSSVEAIPGQGLSQLASQGALGVDDTRMDLSQFDEGSGRSVPTTPLQVSPPADATASDLPELLLQQPAQGGAVASSTSTTISNVSQTSTLASSNTCEPVTSTQGIPTITVTGHDEVEEVSQSSNSSGGNGTQEAQPIIEEPSCTEEAAPCSPAEGPLISEIVSLQGERGDGDKEGETSTNPDDGSSETASTSSQVTTRKVNRRPIVWKQSDAGRGGRSGTFPPPPTRGAARGVARGTKSSRATPPGSGPATTRGGWPGRSWRGGPGRPNQ